MLCWKILEDVQRDCSRREEIVGKSVGIGNPHLILEISYLEPNPMASSTGATLVLQVPDVMKVP